MDQAKATPEDSKAGPDGSGSGQKPQGLRR